MGCCLFFYLLAGMAPSPHSAADWDCLFYIQSAHHPSTRPSVHYIRVTCVRYCCGCCCSFGISFSIPTPPPPPPPPLHNSSQVLILPHLPPSLRPRPLLVVLLLLLLRLLSLLERNIISFLEAFSVTVWPLTGIRNVDNTVLRPDHPSL